MKKNHNILLLLILIPLRMIATEQIYPTRTIENVSDGVIVTYTFNDYTINESKYFSGSYIWDIPGFGINDEQGEPAIPFKKDLFYIPNEYSTSVELMDCVYSDTSFVFAPAIPPMLNSSNKIILDSIKPYSGFFPNNVINILPMEKYRGENIQSIITLPVQYDYEHNIVRHYSKIRYKINYMPLGGNLNTENKPKFYGSDNLLASFAINYQEYVNPKKNIRKTIGLRRSSLENNNYLIITTTDYANSLNGFVDWKRNKGYSVFVETKNKGAWTTANVKETVSNYFQAYGIKQLLIVGGFDDVPADSMAHMFQGEYIKGVTDFKYSLPTAIDSIPQIHRGRIPVDSSAEASIIFSKIINYECNPVIDEDFYNTGLNCAYFQDEPKDTIPPDGYEDGAFISTSENIRNHLIQNYNKTVNRVYCASSNVNPMYWNSGLYSYGGMIPNELQRSNFAWDGNANDIKELINAGAFYVFHRDHGNVAYWGSPYFSNSHVADLNNGNKLPVIFSIDCLVGKYNEPGNCLAETFIKKQNGGCVAIIAATEQSISGHNDALSLGMFDAIWPHLELTYFLKGYMTYYCTPTPTPTYELGQILDQGLFRMSETYNRGFTGDINYTKYLFHCFGDPSMMIFTENPSTFAKPNIYIYGDSIYVETNDGDCRITFNDRDSLMVSSYYGNYASHKINDIDNLTVCLDKHNFVPYVWTSASDIYIQNENIYNSHRAYIGNSIYIGNNVTPTREIGDVGINNSDVNVTGNKLIIKPGTKIKTSNFKFKIK